ncbi:MAG: sulfite exporter TauE/SafE family protein [Bacteroidetes bacterium]|jgi:ABC-type nickel/cobalt efflux system permease component RcnA|nr:sulfite exporter TauE/SafE family protein [Bacteroidota bacterium]
MIHFPLFAGVLSSMTHVVAGPDHLAAVTPLVFESKKKAWKIGVSWGLGHLAGMLSIGVLFSIFNELIPIELISNFSEQLVGIVLIVIGTWAFIKIFKKDKQHAHPHLHLENKAFIHVHEHQHKQGHEHHHHEKKHQAASFSVGYLHGLAGIAHFLIFLPILSFQSTLDKFLYLFGFAFGTVFAMTLYAIALHSVSSITKREHNPIFFKGIRLAGAMFAVVIGIYWVLKV